MLHPVPATTALSDKRLEGSRIAVAAAPVEVELNSESRKEPGAAHPITEEEQQQQPRRRLGSFLPEKPEK